MGTPDEAEVTRQELIGQRTDPLDPSQYAAGSFGCHEALHTAHLIAAAIDRELLEHGAVPANPEWFALAYRASALLNDLYQAIGASHVDQEIDDSLGGRLGDRAS